VSDAGCLLRKVWIRDNARTSTKLRCQESRVPKKKEEGGRGVRWTLPSSLG
jgi:hypothetical protein